MTHSLTARNTWTVGLALLLVGFACAQPSYAQDSGDQATQLQQLQSRLAQMEREQQELKQQIDSMQQAQKAAAPATTEAATAPAPTGQVVAETAANEDSAKVPHELVGNQPLPEKKGTTLDIYGFAMLDSGYDFKSNDPAWFDVVRPTKLASTPGQFAPDGKTYWGVRQTRFGVKTATATPFGELTTRFEWELFGVGGDAGQTTFRLRHAYGELGQFGAGQTWSPFMDIDVFPNSIEYWGPTGMVFYRNVQFRWMPVKGKRHNVTIAAERPGASADAGDFRDRIELANVKPQFTIPDFSGHYRFMGEKGHVQLAGIIRKISWADLAGTVAPLNNTVWGWGANITSNWKFTPKDVGKFSVVYGHGITNYMNDGTVDVGIKRAAANAAAEGKALPLLGVVAFVDHTWNEKFSTSTGYSLEHLNNANGDSANAYHEGHYALVNLLFYPVKQVMFGSEFQWGRRVNFADGFNTNDYRIQFSVRYDWAKAFSFNQQ